MKKLKKILAAATTAAVSAVSLCSMFSASADAVPLKTYRVFHNVSANSDVTYFDYTIQYSSNVTANPSVKTNLLNNGYFTSTNNGKVQATYLGNAITSSGTVATTDFYTPMSVSSIFNEISYSATVRNSSNNNIDPNTITMDSVLVGDVNLDGVVDSTDIIVLNRYLLSSTEYPLTEKGLLAANTVFDFDANGNPVINSNDSAAITNYVLKVIDHF